MKKCLTSLARLVDKYSNVKNNFAASYEYLYSHGHVKRMNSILVFL